MIDSKVVVTQVQEMQVIIDDLLVEGIILHNTCFKHIKFVLHTYIIFIVRLVVNDVLHVASIIEKLPCFGRTSKAT